MRNPNNEITVANRLRLDFVRRRLAELFDKAQQDELSGAIVVRVPALLGRIGKAKVIIEHWESEQ